MISTRIALVLAVLAATPAGAAVWTLDKAASHIGFSGTQVGEAFSGQFKSFDATIEFDPAHPEAGHALVLIDMASAVTGDKQRDEALPQADWFDVAKMKQARFEATRFVSKGDGAYEAVGSLTIRDVKRDVTLPFKLTMDHGVAHAVGRLQLIRTEFHVGQGDWSTGQWVGLDVGVDVDISAKAAETTQGN